MFQPFGNELPALLAVCSFCDYFIVFLCLSGWCWGLEVNLIVPIPEFSVLFIK